MILSSLLAKAYIFILISFILYSCFFIVSSLALNLLLIFKSIFYFTIYYTPASSSSELS